MTREYNVDELVGDTGPVSLEELDRRWLQAQVILGARKLRRARCLCAWLIGFALGEAIVLGVLWR
jgi:hypothetical protein